MNDENRIPALPLSRALKCMWDSDLLLLRRRGLIAAAGRTEYSHAAKFFWWGSRGFALEVREWHGGRAVTLDSQVRRYPGRIDVYRVDSIRFSEYDRLGALHVMQQFAGGDYGWWNVLRAGFLHLPFVRCLIRPETDDEANGHHPPFCSQACAWADRLGGGVDPVPHLADRLTEPGDLARSSLYRFRFTLVPD
jgi:hypothetical protein